MASGPDVRFDGPLLSDEEIAAAAALDDRLRAGTAGSDKHAAFPNPAAGFEGTVRLLRDVLGRHQNDGIVNRGRTSKTATEISSQAIDSAAQTLPLDGSAPNRDPSLRTVGLVAVVEYLPKRFTILAELGRGSYGIVYRAHDKSLKRDVAIKILRPELMTDDNLRRRFLQESQAAARLNHPCIVRVFEAQESTQVTWQVSEFVEGTTLSQHLTGQPMSERIAARLMRDLSDAVEHAHRFSVLHRDIKPDNILIDRMPGELLDSATPRLTDFGLARIMDLAMRMSHSGTLVGTPRYMAPEQLTGSNSQHGPATDIYSLGVVLYELLAGYGPFQGIDSLVQRVATVRSPVPSVRQKQSSVSLDLATICSRCLEFRPADRYASAADLRDDLQRFLDGRPTLARPLSAMESLWRWASRNPAIAALTALTVAILVFSLGLTLRSNVAFKEQNDQLGKLNTELKAEQQRALELNTLAEVSRQRAESGERRFQKLAWNAGIRQAYSAWEHHEVPEALHLLDELKATDTKAESRIEWQMLHQDVSSICRRLLTINTPIHELRLIPDSPLVVAAGGDGKLYVMNFVTGELTRTIATTAPSLNALTVSADGKLLATGGVVHLDTDLSYPEVYDVSTGEMVCKLPGFLTTIESLEFSTDGNWLACGARYENLKFIHLKSMEVIEVPATASRRHLWLTHCGRTPQLLAQSAVNAFWISEGTPPFNGKELNLPFAFALALAVPNTNLMLCSLDYEVNLQLIDITRADVLCRFTGGVQDVKAMDLAADLSLLSAGLTNGDLVCWRFPETQGKGEYHSGDSELAIQSRAVTDNSGHLEHLPDVPTFREFVRWHLFECPVTAVLVTDDRILVSSLDGGLVSLARWLPESGRLSLNISPDSMVTHVTSLAWNPDGNELAIGDRTGITHINRFQDPSTAFPGAGIDRNGVDAPATIVHTNSFDGNSDQTVVLSENTHIGSAVNVAVSPNGRILGISHDRQGLAVRCIDCEVNLGKWAPSEADDSEIFFSEMKFSNDSQKIAWTGDHSKLHIGPIGLESSEILNIDLSGHGWCLAWSPDDRFVFAGGRFDDVLEVEVRSGTQRVLMRHGANSTAMIFDQHRSQLITGHTDGTLRFINPEKCEVTHVLQFHDVNIRSIALSRDGRIGISADTNGNLAVWFAETGERIGKLASMSERSERPLEFSPVKPALIFTEDDAAFRLVYVTYDNKLATKSWRFK